MGSVAILTYRRRDFPLGYAGSEVRLNSNLIQFSDIGVFSTAPGGVGVGRFRDAGIASNLGRDCVKVSLIKRQHHTMPKFWESPVAGSNEFGHTISREA